MVHGRRRLDRRPKLPLPAIRADRRSDRRPQRARRHRLQGARVTMLGRIVLAMIVLVLGSLVLAWLAGLALLLKVGLQ